jgi:cytochrome c peroxidase
MNWRALNTCVVSWVGSFLLVSVADANGFAAAPSLGLPPLPVRPDIVSGNLAKLGKRLFFDVRLSGDGTVSCGSCHMPEHAFTDGRALAIGIAGQKGTRNAPSLLNVAYANSLFWDGRATTLESQARLPLLNPREHGLTSESSLIDRIGADPEYRNAFELVFGRVTITADDVMKALASYERTLLAGNAPFDRFVYGGDQRAMSDAAIRGLELFRGRARCAACHTIGKESALLTDQEFHASPIGLSATTNGFLVELTKQVTDAQQRGDMNQLNSLIVGNREIASLGRFVVTRNPHDIGLFKTPSLRNVSLTAPYLHDGSIATLAEVVDAELYSRGDAIRYPIVMTAQQKADLIEFLKALCSP